MAYNMYVCPTCRRVFKINGAGKKAKCTKCENSVLVDTCEFEDDWKTYNIDKRNSIIDVILDEPEIIEVEEPEPKGFKETKPQEVKKTKPERIEEPEPQSVFQRFAFSDDSEVIKKDENKPKPAPKMPEKLQEDAAVVKTEESPKQEASKKLTTSSSSFFDFDETDSPIANTFATQASSSIFDVGNTNTISNNNPSTEDQQYNHPTKTTNDVTINNSGNTRNVSFDHNIIKKIIIAAVIVVFVGVIILASSLIIKNKRNNKDVAANDSKPSINTELKSESSGTDSTSPSTKTRKERDGHSSITNHVVRLGCFDIEFPSYWEEENSEYAFLAHAEYENGLAMLKAETIDMSGIDLLSNASSLDDYYTYSFALADEAIDTYLSQFDESSVTSSKQYNVSDTIQTMIYDVRIKQFGYDCDGKVVCVPDYITDSWHFIYLIVSDNSDFLYDYDFSKSLDSLTYIFSSEDVSDADNSVNETSNTTSIGGSVNPDLKAFLDGYEDFVDDYIAFMKKYDSSDDVMSMMSDYTKMLNDMAEYEKALNKYDEKNMSKADYDYYIEVTTRCSAKLMKAAY